MCRAGRARRSLYPFLRVIVQIKLLGVLCIFPAVSGRARIQRAAGTLSTAFVLRIPRTGRVNREGSCRAGARSGVRTRDSRLGRPLHYHCATRAYPGVKYPRTKHIHKSTSLDQRKTACMIGSTAAIAIMMASTMRILLMFLPA